MPLQSREKAYRGLLELHDDVERRARALERRHGARLRCRRGCSPCCVDGLTVFEVEAERIRRGAGELLRSGAPHPRGACAFLDASGACRIYEHRPYVCRTQGLPLRWLEEDEESGALLERRDICPLNAEGEPLATLAPGECWPIGDAEERLARLQQDFGGPGGARVPLRGLFERC